MADIVDKSTRSRMMAGIRGKDTKPELAIRRALHARGFRYRLHAPDIVGKPDLIFPKYKALIFVHGCFWHRHHGCRFATTPSTRTEFWRLKFAKNVSRDVAVRSRLMREGWRVGTVWECSLKKPEFFSKAIDQLEEWLRSDIGQVEIG